MLGGDAAMNLRERLIPLFSSRGKLDGCGYAKHVAIAFALFFAIATVGMALFFCLVGLFIHLKAPAWLAFLPVLAYLPFGIAAIAAWLAIMASSTVRFLRYVKDELAA